jgi:uncharacterized protein YgbK (DUF1537 family)
MSDRGSRGAAKTGLRDLLIVADDLTGACDAAVAFAQRALVRVCVDDQPPGHDGVWGINTSSRDVTPADAEKILARVAGGIPKDRTIFKKVDSVFRGNTLVEIAATCQCFPADLIVLAPAYPELGRTVQRGKLYVQSEGESCCLDVVAGLQACGCDATVLGVSNSSESLAHAKQESLAAGKRLVLCDAGTQEHMNAIVSAAGQLDRQTLWIGSGGLAHALALQWAQAPGGADMPLPRGRTVFCVGSDHPATRQQLLSMHETARVPVYPCNAPAMPAHSSFALEITSRTTPSHVQAALSAISRDEIACLFVTGGDTARLVCRALGIETLRLLQEFAPGVPLGLVEGGRFDGIPVMLKSGGFGECDLLLRVLEAFGNEERGPA